jgi:hypothetical protein
VEVFGRFEADHANERWMGDALHGPTVGGRKAILFAFIDDHSRVLTGYRWVRREDTLRAEAALRAGIGARGIPNSVYVDNGSPFIDAQFHRALAVLGIKPVHATPNRPQGKAKIERFFRTVRTQFLVEIGTGRELDSMEQLNRLFTAWVETEYHARVHTETGQTPLTRWADSWARAVAAGGRPAAPRLADPGLLAEAFLWSTWRTVTKTATISLEGNIYEVDPALAGHKVELVFDPFTMDDITVRWAGKNMGKAAPHIIRAHVHRKARPDETTLAPQATGIDYLALLADRHEQALTTKITYHLPATGHEEQLPGQGSIEDFLAENDDDQQQVAS